MQGLGGGGGGTLKRRRGTAPSSSQPLLSAAPAACRGRRLDGGAVQRLALHIAPSSSQHLLDGGAVQGLGLEEHHRVGVADARQQQPLGLRGLSLPSRLMTTHPPAHPR
jgi:hypothetical protein